MALNVSDGSVNGTVDIHMSSLLFAGGDLTHSARAEDTTSDMTQAVDSGRAFAIDANLDFAGYDRAGYELEFVSTPWLSSGFLAARGIGVPECASEPVQRDSYAVSQGCEGTSTTDLWRIEWTVEP